VLPTFKSIREVMYREALQLEPEGHSLKQHTEHFSKQLPNSHQYPLLPAKKSHTPYIPVRKSSAQKEKARCWFAALKTNQTNLNKHLAETLQNNQF